MGHANPFHKDPLLGEMHRCVIEHIRRPSFSFTLPNLNAEAWKIICTDPRARERLEFLGDSIIGTQVSEGLIQHWPSETPGFYTKCRTVLVANATFAYLMWKAGICKIDKSVKPAGDAFEAILALYQEKHGLASFRRYVFHAFGPLFKTVGEAYYENIDKSRKKKNKIQLTDRKLNLAAKSAKEVASAVYRRHDTNRSMKLTLINKKQRIYENQSPKKSPRKAAIPSAVPLLQSQPQSDSRQLNVVDLTQASHNSCVLFEKPVRGSDFSGTAAVSSRTTAANNLPSFPVKAEPFEPILNNTQIMSPPIKESTRAPIEVPKPLQYPIFTSRQSMANQTQAILISASESQEHIQDQNQTQSPLGASVAPDPPSPPPLPPYPPMNTKTNARPSLNPTTTWKRIPKHIRVASGTADDLAAMFASQATLAHAAVSSPTIESVPASKEVSGHGTKENPITILDDD